LDHLTVAVNMCLLRLSEVNSFASREVVTWLWNAWPARQSHRPHSLDTETSPPPPVNVQNVTKLKNLGRCDRCLGLCMYLRMRRGAEDFDVVESAFPR
jgi:hypothetical protein